MIYVTGFWDFTYSVKLFFGRHKIPVIILGAIFVCGFVFGVSSAVAAPLEAGARYYNYFILRYLFHNRRFLYYLFINFAFFALALAVIFLFTRIVWLFPLLLLFFALAGFRLAVPIILLYRLSGPITLPFLIVFCIFKAAYFVKLWCYGAAMFRYTCELRRYGGGCDHRYLAVMTLCYIAAGLVLLTVMCIITHAFSALIAGVAL